jgi:hypothetical protein
MSAIFDFSSVLMILLLMICTSTYLRELRPGIFDGSQVRTVTIYEIEHEQQKRRKSLFEYK